MDIVLPEPWPIERFLSWEDGQEARHEFDGSRIIEITGGTRAHQRIIVNLMRLLLDRLDPAGFDAVQEMRVAVGGRVRYPDVAVCAGRIPDGERTLRDAVVLFEVLSDETAAIDRTEKRGEYGLLPGVRRYILLQQDRPAALVLQRIAEGWRETVVDTGLIALPELGIDLPLDEIYRGLRHPPAG